MARDLGNKRPGRFRKSPPFMNPIIDTLLVCRVDFRYTRVSEFRMPNASEHPPHLIVTIHGIRTFGHWQERLEALVSTDSNSDVEFANYKYGYFSIIAFII